MKYVPKKYQDVAITRMIVQRLLGLFLDPGLGKTSTVLTAFDQMREMFEADKMLVIAPLAVCYNVWPQEVAKWDHVKHLRVEILHGRKKEEALDRDADIYVINPEGIKWLCEHKDWEWPDTLVIDESTKFKRTGTARFRALRKMLPKFSRRYILTGTPTPSGLKDLYGQLYCLDLGKLLGKNMSTFQRKYFVPVPRGDYYDWEIRDEAPEEIYEKIAPIVLRLEGEDLDLPEIQVIDIPVQLPPSVRALYDQFQQEMVVNLEQGEVVALNAGSLTAKCRQIANGRIYLEDQLPGGPEPIPDGTIDGRAYADVHDAKVDAVRRIVDELNGKPILFSYEFKHDRVGLEKAVGEKIPLLKGSDTKMVAAWNAGDLPYMVAHPASVGHGLNLQEGPGHVNMWLGPTYNWEFYNQMIKRLARQGQASPYVLVYRFICRNTADVGAAHSVGLKEVTERALLDALREDLT